MNISLFEVLGPVMIGPSSSHTAGAARLSRIAAQISGKEFNKVHFALHGSFAKTGKGHGTDKALLAGTMGMLESDERIANAFEIADEKKLEYTFGVVDLPECHENTVQITFYHLDGATTFVQGSSIGGGRIVITRIGDLKTEFTADVPTLLIKQKDIKGVVSTISSTIAACGINIGTMNVTRDRRGEVANTVVETDDEIPMFIADALKEHREILEVKIINPNKAQ